MEPRVVLDDGSNLVALGDGEVTANLPIARVDYATFSRWDLSEAERAALVSGGSILLAQMNGNEKLQPSRLLVCSDEGPLLRQNLVDLMKEMDPRRFDRPRVVTALNSTDPIAIILTRNTWLNLAEFIASAVLHYGTDGSREDKLKAEALLKTLKYIVARTRE